MTNGEIIKLFKKNYPSFVVDDYRPIADMFVPKDKEGIVIWIENGDTLLYFPRTDTKMTYDEEKKKNLEKFMAEKGE